MLGVDGSTGLAGEDLMLPFMQMIELVSLLCSKYFTLWSASVQCTMPEIMPQTIVSDTQKRLLAMLRIRRVEDAFLSDNLLNRHLNQQM